MLAQNSYLTPEIGYSLVRSAPKAGAARWPSAEKKDLSSVVKCRLTPASVRLKSCPVTCLQARRFYCPGLLLFFFGLASGSFARGIAGSVLRAVPGGPSGRV